MSHKIHYILFLLFSVISYGQVNIAIDTDKKEIAKNERITVTIVQEVVGSEYVQESKLMLPDFSKFKTIGTGSDQKTFIDKGTNELVNQMVYIVVLEPKVTGNIKIGSALIRFSGKIYKSEPFDITVTPEDRGKAVVTNDEVFLNMEVENREVFENEPTLAVIRGYSKNFNNLRNVGNISIPDQKEVEIKPISFERSDIEQNPAKKMLSQVMAVVMIYPSKSGTVEVKPLTATYSNGGQETKLKTNKVSLNVKNLPGNSPKNYRNTVGNYSMSISSSTVKKRVEINKPLDVVVKVKGVGNLDAAGLPKLAASENYSFYAPEVAMQIHNTEEGAKGQLIAKYVVIPKVSGDIKISTEGFSFFNPKTKKYTDLGNKEIDLHVMTPEQVADDKTALEKVNDYTNNVLETVSTPVMETTKLKVKPESRLNWTTLLTNYSLIGLFFVAILAGAWYFRKNFATSPALDLGSVQETENTLRTLQGFDAGIHLDYLQKQVSNGHFNEFFRDFEQMRIDAEEFVGQKYQAGLKNYFEKNHGSKLAEDYQAVIQQFQIEKYSPVHTKEQLESLLGKAKVLFTLIE